MASVNDSDFVSVLEDAEGSAYLSQLYKALVLPKLDFFCSPVWDPHSITLTDRLKSVQRLAAKLCSKCWSDSSPQILSSLKLPSLRSHRIRQKAQLCRRIIRNESIIQPHSYFHPLSNPNPRIHHSCPVSVPFSRTTSFQSSFFVSACQPWNSLPDSVVTLTSARSFKAALLQLPSLSISFHLSPF